MSLGVPTTELPRQFGKYFILGHLATGGMAEVYLARAAGIEGFEKIVVIKRIRPDLTSDSNTTGQFLDEARLVATLDHPNIAQVYEIGFVQGSYFFVMEYVQGADLRQLIKASIRKKQAIGLAHALYIMIDVCAALHYAHTKTDDGKKLHIIHRDVSPSNVLISHDGAVKVCDFGIAKASTRNTETARGTLKGKFSYMSPEQCRCEPLDARSDVFAIGILLYELTTLKKLFDGPSDFELMKAVLEKPIPPPSSVSKAYHPDLERIVMRALERDPDKRYETAQEMQADLEDFAREHKLALSSIGITELMGSLFEKQADAHMRAKRASQVLFDPAQSFRESQPIPLLSRVETQDGDVFVLDMDDTVGATPKRMPVGTVDPAPTSSRGAVRGRRRRAVWGIAALLVALIAGGLTVAERMHAFRSSNAAGLRADLDQAAERLAFTVDSAARTARTRVDGLAATPMLRAAIDTDESTMRDVFASELGFTPEPGEVVEVFQNRGTETALMIRVPAEAVALVPLAGRSQRIQSDGANLSLIVAAPVKGKEMTGLVQIASKIDLGPIHPRLASGFTSAKLVGLETDVALIVGDGKGESVTVAVPVSGEKALQLIAMAKPGAATTWTNPVRWASAALAALLLLIFVVGTRKVEGR